MTLQTVETYAFKALSYSQHMYLLAEQANWDKLAEFEAQRTDVLDSLFNHPSLPTLLINIASILQQIIDIDKKTMALEKSAKKTLENEIKLLKQSKRKRAVNAYMGNVAFQKMV